MRREAQGPARARQSARRRGPRPSRAWTACARSSQRLTRPGRLAPGFWAAATVSLRGGGAIGTPPPSAAACDPGSPPGARAGSRGDGLAGPGAATRGRRGPVGEGCAATRPELARSSGDAEAHSVAWQYTSPRARAQTHTPRTRSSCAGGGRDVRGGAAGANGNRGFQTAPKPQPMAAGGRSGDPPAPPRALPAKVTGGTRARLGRSWSWRVRRAGCRGLGVPSRGGSPGGDPREPPILRVGVQRSAHPGAQLAQREEAVLPPQGPRSAAALGTQQPVTPAKC